MYNRNNVRSPSRIHNPARSPARLRSPVRTQEYRHDYEGFHRNHGTHGNYHHYHHGYNTGANAGSFLLGTATGALLGSAAYGSPYYSQYPYYAQNPYYPRSYYY